ncbi:unnamed protein product [Chrysoparadoxa australica]
MRKFCLIALAAILTRAESMASSLRGSEAEITTGSDQSIFQEGQARRRLISTPSGPGPYSFSTPLLTGLTSGHAYSLWGVIFNHPEQCPGWPAAAGGLPCSIMDDFMGLVLNPNPSHSCTTGNCGIVLMNVGGFVASGSTHTATVNIEKGVTWAGCSTPFDPEGLGLKRDLSEVQMEVLVRDHGPVVPGYWNKQMTTIDGMCTTASVFSALQGSCPGVGAGNTQLRVFDSQTASSPTVAPAYSCYDLMENHFVVSGEAETGGPPSSFTLAAKFPDSTSDTDGWDYDSSRWTDTSTTGTTSSSTYKGSAFNYDDVRYVKLEFTQSGQSTKELIIDMGEQFGSLREMFLTDYAEKDIQKPWKVWINNAWEDIKPKHWIDMFTNDIFVQTGSWGIGYNMNSSVNGGSSPRNARFGLVMDECTDQYASPVICSTDGKKLWSVNSAIGLGLNGYFTIGAGADARMLSSSLTSQCSSGSQECVDFGWSTSSTSSTSTKPAAVSMYVAV